MDRENERFIDLGELWGGGEKVQAPTPENIAKAKSEMFAGDNLMRRVGGQKRTNKPTPKPHKLHEGRYPWLW